MANEPIREILTKKDNQWNINQSAQLEQIVNQNHQ